MSKRVKAVFLMQLSNANDGVTPSNTLLDGTETAIVATFTTAPVKVDECDAFAISFSTLAGSTLAGSVAIQESCDQSGQELTGTPDKQLVNWQTASFWDEGAGAQATTKAVVSGAQTLILAQRVCAVRWVRLVFTFTGGSGQPKVSFQQKGVS